MSSREERERGWRTNPEAATASGGHLTPDPVAADAWPDALSAPLPSELEKLERDRARPELDRAMGSVSAQARTEMFPPSEQTLRTRESERPATVKKTVRRRVPVRRVKRTLRHVDPLTVLKLSAFYWAIFLVVWLGVVAVAYSVINGLGYIDDVDSFMRAVEVDWPDITLGVVERWAFLIGIVFALVTTLLNVFLAFLYNVAADLIGGLELTFVERDSS
ncbi:MAG TPA: DUF3566 domain-containing protein [Actinomycetota bacterium]|nr:DUF3566 domain-containing protein [Actinomycetota bacterium]